MAATKSATKGVAEAEPYRVHNQEFFKGVVDRSHLPMEVVSDVYDAMLAEMFAIFARGDYLVLRGLGRFYPQVHRGHQVQFTSDRSRIDDYVVLKFSAARGIGAYIAQLQRENA